VQFLNTDELHDEEICLRLDHTAEANPVRGWVPAYYFDICLADGTAVGKCDLRIGHNEGLYYGGNIGYEVREAYRGRHYAGKACKLMFPLARAHGLEYLYITCNPDNWPSRKTCEYAGGTLVGIVDLPEDNDMYLDGDRQKCVYRFDL